jgi:hypothetical protein
MEENVRNNCLNRNLITPSTFPRPCSRTVWEKLKLVATSEIVKENKKTKITIARLALPETAYEKEPTH